MPETNRASGGVDQRFFRRYRNLLDEEDAAVGEFEHAYEAAKTSVGRVEPSAVPLSGAVSRETLSAEGQQALCHVGEGGVGLAHLEEEAPGPWDVARPLLEVGERVPEA